MSIQLPSDRTRHLEKTRSKSNDQEPLTTEEIFHVLSNRRRRYAIHYLNQVEETVSIRDLSEQIAAWEHSVDRSAVTPKRRKRIYTSLHQGHLPTMDRLGVVEYDNERGTVRPADRAQDFEIYLDVVPSGDIPWNQFMLGLGATLTALVTVAWIGIPPFSYFGGFPYALAACLLIIGVSGHNVLTDTRRKIGHTSDLDVDPPEEVEFES